MQTINLDLNARTAFGGYQGEHNATAIVYSLPDELINQDYTYTVDIELPDGTAISTNINNYRLPLTAALTALSGTIKLQLSITNGGKLIQKSSVVQLSIHPSLIPNSTITSGDGTSIQSAEVNADGHLILTLTDDTTIDCGYVVGPQGVKGDTGEQGPQGEKGDNSHWRVIADITLDEDVKTIEITTDTYGEPFTLTELYVVTNATSTSTTEQGKFAISVNGKPLRGPDDTINAHVNIGKSGDNGRVWAWIKSLYPLISLQGAWQTTTSIDNKSVYCVQPGFKAYSNALFAEGEQIVKIGISASSNATTFAAGSQFIVFGR